jgi:hypothetical protein
MKKFIPILLVAVLALTGCQNKNPYAGVYSGTFTFVTDNVTKDGKMQFLTNPLTDGLFLYSVVPLSQASSTHYVSNSQILDYVTILLESIGYTNHIYDTATEQIKNVAIDVNFNGNTVYAELSYEIEILGTLNTRITIVKFQGVK